MLMNHDRVLASTHGRHSALWRASLCFALPFVVACGSNSGGDSGGPTGAGSSNPGESSTTVGGSTVTGGGSGSPTTPGSSVAGSGTGGAGSTTTPGAPTSSGGAATPAVPGGTAGGGTGTTASPTTPGAGAPSGPTPATTPPELPTMDPDDATGWGNVRFDGGGFVAGVEASTTVEGLVYARTDVGGVYRWDATSSVWVPLMDWLSQDDVGLLGVESFALDPNNRAARAGVERL